jgi:leader peptidase (prepilin peptidase)/N-methyltransferase
MIVLYAILGLVVGAFLNWCADQLPTAQRRLYRIPYCPYCETPRAPLAWSGTLAYAALRVQCPSCGAPIPWRAPLTELGTAVLFGWLWAMHGPGVLLFLHSVYGAILILVTVIDLEHRLILNVVIYPAYVVALLGSLIHPQPFFYRLALIGGVVGFGIMFVLYQLGVLFVRAVGRMRGQELNTVALGFGDVRLAGFLGLVVGFPDILYALILAVTLGGLAGLVYWFVRAVILRRYSLFSAIPYGPYLVAGGLIMLLYGQEVIRWWSGA